MLNKYEQIEKIIVEKIYKEFLLKYEGNKSKFAKASFCSETTVRRVFSNKQRMTVDLLLRFCDALNIKITDLLNKIEY
jgi:DNA-binding Xre family transcriptional regulator